ncbi:MAG: PAS domain S-box protein [Elusimicrobiaceae bacterium]|jgi:PAS domain S-box-containing protein
MKRLQTKHYHKITEQLRAARAEAGLRQETAAKLLGTTQSYLSKAEAGKLRIDLVQLRRFSKLYKKDLSYFLDDTASVTTGKSPESEPGIDWPGVIGDMNCGVWAVNDDGITLTVNRAMADMLGYPMAEMAGRMIGEFMRADSALQLLKDLRSRDQGAREMSDAEFIHKNGEPVLADIITSAVTDGQGNLSGGVIFAMPSGLREKNKEILRTSSKLIDESFDAVILLQDGVIKYANKTACSLSAYGYEELRGRDFLTLITPELRGEVARRHAMRVKGAKLPATLETRIQLKNGKHLDVELVMGNLLYKGKPAYIVVARDISKRKMQEEETKYRLESAQDETLRKCRTMAAVAADLADGASVLSALSGESGALKRLSEKLAADFHKVSEETPSLPQPDFNPHDLIARTVKRVKSAFSGKNRLAIQIETSPGIPVTLKGNGRAALAAAENIMRNTANFSRGAAIAVKAEYKTGGNGFLKLEFSAQGDVTPEADIKKTIIQKQFHGANPVLSLAAFLADSGSIS